MLVKDLILKIDVPEYVSCQELYISELCNSISNIDWESKYTPENNSKLGLIFDSRGENGGKAVTIKSTCPESDEDVKKWEEALKDSGLQVSPEIMKDVADAILKSLIGVPAKKQRRKAAVPLTPNIALLQDRWGSTGKGGPANIAKIIEQMYRLGGETVDSGLVDDSETAIKNLHRAMHYRIKNNSFLDVIDRAVNKGIFPPGAANSGSFDEIDQPDIKEGQAGFNGQTPYGWFRESWDLLTSEEWVKALTPRRWTDWATTLLRTAYGFGFLWEMRWHEEIAKKIMSTEERTDIEKSDLIELTNSSCTLKWADSMLGTSSRDVSSSLKKLISRGVHIQEAVAAISKKNPEAQAADFFNDVEFEDIEEINRSVSAPYSSRAKSRWEVIRYALATRDDAEDGTPDYYGLLRPVGARYLTVDPSTEWTAVVASLAIGDPGSTGTLGDVQKALLKLGLQPTTQELIRRLEWAGLARSTPDADLGVNVESAF